MTGAPAGTADEGRRADYRKPTAAFDEFARDFASDFQTQENEIMV